MSDLHVYRLAFAPALAALVVLAFSLEGVPAPVEPPPGTIEFDATGAAQATRSVLAAGESRTPGSQTDAAVADLVRKRFEVVVSGSVAEQRIEASVDGEDVELRNVILTLPGRTDRAILIVAGRDSREGPGAPASAAATGMLLELTDALSVSDRERTLVLASTSGASLEARGARELVGALPDRTVVDAAIVIAQPGADQPTEPHLVVSGDRSASIGLIETVEELLRTRSRVDGGLPGTLGQVARLALPVGAGEQAALIAEGLDAVAISSAGEVPLPPGEGGTDSFDTATLARFGTTVLGVVTAIDAAPEPPVHGPDTYVRIGDNLIPGWGISLLALTLLVPPAAFCASVLARARRRGEKLWRGLGWAGEWCLPVLVLLGALYLLSILGLIPGSGTPYDPGRYEIGGTEAATLLLLLTLACSSWSALGLRRVPSSPGPRPLGALSGSLAILACGLAWLANPVLALVLAPLGHVVCVLGTSGRKPAGLAIPALVLSALPLFASVVYLAGALDWGASTLWQLVVLTGGGGLGVLDVAATLLALATVAGAVRAALETSRRDKSGGDAPSPRLGGRPRRTQDGRLFDVSQMSNWRWQGTDQQPMDRHWQLL